METIINRVRDFIIENNLIKKGDKVGCALSGGADSIFMTYALKKLSFFMGFKVFAFHVNHMLRGDESLRDENFSREFSEKLGIEFKSFKCDILKYSKDKKISIEMAGREVRYNIFNSLKDEGVINKIALAHHADDDVETIIMRIFKGTGVDGLCGIKPIRDDFYIRPILFLRRKEDIERVLNEENISFIIDKSNLSHDYLRNKIRLSIIPELNESFNKNISKNVLSLKEICSYDSDYFDYIVKDNMDKYLVNYSHNEYVDLHKDIFKLHKSIHYRVIRKVIFLFNNSLNDINLSSIKYIEELLDKKINKTICLKKNLFCINKEFHIRFSRTPQLYEDKKDENIYLLNKEEISLLKEGKLHSINKDFVFLGKKMKLSLERDLNKNRDLTLKHTKYFSIDNLNERVSLRNRRYGDTFCPYSMDKDKKLKDFLINEKVKDKDSIPLLCFDDIIVWVYGIRNSNYFKVRDDQKIVKIKLEFTGD